VKNSILLFSILLISLAALLMKCENYESSEEGRCSESSWDHAENPIIRVRISQPLDHCDNNTHRADTAEYIIITGSIQKFYCVGTPSGKFNFGNNVQPGPNITYHTVGQAYQFKFENDEDNLVVKCSLKAHFTDGNSYESDEVKKIFYYRDIKLDINALEYYILFDLPNLNWHQSL